MGSGKRRQSRRVSASLLVLILGCTSGVTAQQDSVTVQAGARYAGGGVKRALLGSAYRDLWTAPIRVPVLSPDTFAGGLHFLELGGGRQTVSVRLGNEQGREFVFRSVDKEQTGGLHPDLQETLIDYIIQDQISAKHPGANLVLPPLLKAAEVLHVTPTMATMTDHPVLGEHRETFSGMLGTIEERPTETEGAGPFGKYERVIGTERLRERLEESPEDRADAEAFLAARLMDFLVGDWDRHDDQWRWAQTDVGEKRIWLPIPRDRDNAFFDADGLIGKVGTAVRPYMISFDDTYPSLIGLTYNSRDLDRRILPELPRETWDSVAIELRARLTDEVIAEAVRQLPTPYYELSGPRLEQSLRARRDALPAITNEFYLQIVREVDVYGTDVPDRATVERRADGSVRVQLDTEEHGVYFERVFDPSETREIRLYLRGEADTTVVRGGGPSEIQVRAIGGGNDDHFEDSTPEGAGRTLFYDDNEDADTFVLGPSTKVDRREFRLPDSDTVTQNNPPAPRDWGTSSSLFSPSADWRSDIGPVIGIGPRWTRYGFRRFPYARRTSLAIEVAPLEGRFGVTGELHRIRTGGQSEVRLSATASQINLTRFHGYGNDTADGPDPDRMRVWANEYTAALELVEVLGPTVRAAAGPTLTHLDPEPEPGSPAALPGVVGNDAFTLAGLRAWAVHDGRDSDAFPSSGMIVSADAEWYPLAEGDAESGFVRSGVTAAAFRQLPLPLETVLAIRGGGETLWGESPFQYAPSVGGRRSLRGYRTDRFTGDASLFAGAELRSVLGKVNLLLVRGDLGTILHADAGRVFLAGDDDDRWHTAYGGGLWFGPLDREFTAHLLLSQGERLTLVAGLGVPF